MRSRTGTRTSEDHDFREFLDQDGQDEGQDGTRTRKGTRTSEDGDFRKCFGRGRPRRGPGRRRGRDGDKGEDGEDVDVLRRPGLSFLMITFLINSAI